MSVLKSACRGKREREKTAYSFGSVLYQSPVAIYRKIVLIPVFSPWPVINTLFIDLDLFVLYSLIVSLAHFI